jgi:galactose mutarotase-like enzyme
MTTALENVVLTSNEARACLAPERGGMLTRLFVGDRSILYLDEATLLDRTKNVRGGNPVLFPSPGKLENDRWSRDGQSGAMGQHGFARNLAWEIAEQAPDAVTLRIRSTEATRAVYPWDFVVTYRYSLASGTNGTTFRIAQKIENTGFAPMPFGAGFHPYFHVPQAAKARARIPTKATRAWDNAAKRTIDLAEPIDLTGSEVDLHLLDHGSTLATLELGDGHAVTVRGSDAYRRWVIWTLSGRDFVCLEPWTSPGNALTSGEDLLIAQPGDVVDLWVEFSFA